MITPPQAGGWGRSGARAAFSEEADGDLRADRAARTAMAARLGISPDWAVATQVHGGRVVEATGPGDHGPADALFTTRSGLAVAVFTADCAGVVLRAPAAVGVAHAGWRGAVAGVVRSLAEAMADRGHPVTAGAVGPLIGPCCLEVGEEVAAQFPDFRATTTWGTTSIDLRRAISAQLPGIDLWLAGNCTLHEPRWFSHRRDRTPARMAAVGWLP